ncbi:MAG: hypothetical protein KDA22_10435, partial [Phycisphaerales bacterium]|nr:hypothetical protein [Phycisphaerales bacterium]
MLRFLRTHNRWLLAIFGTLLLIVFLIQGSMDTLWKAQAIGGGTWATVGPDAERVTTGARDQVRAELQVIQLIRDPVLQALGADARPEHWYLLTREAEQAGLVGGTSDGLQWLSRMADQFRLQQAAQGITADVDRPEEIAQRLAQQAGQPVGFVLETIAKLNGVRRLFGLYSSAPKLSDRRLEADSERLLLSVGADIVPLDGHALANRSTFEPTEEELAQQLATYGDTVPGAGEYGFGYKLPNRLKVEWIAISNAAIRAALEASPELDNVNLRKHREKNRDLFPSTVADGTDDFETVREAVKQHLLSTLLIERTAEISKFAVDQIAAKQRGLARDGAYIATPDDWAAKRKSLPELAEEIAQQYNMPLPPYQTSGPTWYEPRRLDTLPGIGTATTDKFGSTPLRLSALAAQLKEFGGSDVIALQAGVVGPQLRSPNGDVYVFRAVEVEAARAPLSVDEVRDQLVSDLRALHEYRELVKDEERLHRVASEDGLVTLAGSYGAQVQTAANIRSSDPLSIQRGIPVATPLPVVGVNDEATKAIVALGATLDPLKPASEQPPAERVFTVPVEQKLTMLVGR